MRHVGINMEQVKMQNRSSILHCINEAGSISRKDIAEQTNLTPAAVSQICNQFMESGLLQEFGYAQESVGAGRKKVLVNINYDYCYILTCAIEKEETNIALCNMKGDVLDKKVIPTETNISPNEYLDKIAEILKEFSIQYKKFNIGGISVTIPGIVDNERGISIHAYGIWKEEVKISQILESKLKLPVHVENNVKAFAIAELLFGVGKKYDNFLIIKWGPGVGSSIVIDNKLYHGRHGKSAELGHFIVEKNGETCSCGRKGCLETLVNAHKINDENCENAIDLFARTLVNTMTILEPNRVVLFGNLFHNEKYRNMLIKDCEQYDNRYNNEKIVVSEFINEESVIGPVASFVQNVIF